MISFRYRSTAYYLIPSSGGGLLAFDAGWPCSLREYQRSMKEAGYGFGRLRWAIVSHFHMDHAGLIRDFQDAGIECLAFEGQLEAIDAMEAIIAPKYPGYARIRKDALRPMRAAEGAGYLASIGIAASVVPTPGHSEDSVSLVTEGGEACVGDLYPEEQLMPGDAACRASWDRIRAAGGLRFFYSHAHG
jgi:endoribonuclease LACTB2